MMYCTLMWTLRCTLRHRFLNIGHLIVDPEYIIGKLWYAWREHPNSPKYFSPNFIIPIFETPKVIIPKTYNSDYRKSRNLFCRISQCRRFILPIFIIPKIEKYEVTLARKTVFRVSIFRNFIAVSEIWQSVKWTLSFKKIEVYR